MTLSEHCPVCLSAARIVDQRDDGTHLSTTWRCGSCFRQWRTEYLADAYADGGFEDGGS
ncbi:hypothetical protein ACFYUY_01775 [Kitasatospora sp. NPDC004745]|uniref:hypothetical protein n=1 Tax=Kitasatospora sp. NPDC004745 TaxID=3364019 RepID=UPI0036BA3F43